MLLRLPAAGGLRLHHHAQEYDDRVVGNFPSQDLFVHLKRRPFP